jgi:hypothetical protein
MHCVSGRLDIIVGCDSRSLSHRDMDRGRGRGVSAKIGERSGIAIHHHLASAEGRGISTGRVAGSDCGEVDMLFEVSIVDNISGSASCQG